MATSFPESIGNVSGQFILLFRSALHRFVYDGNLRTRLSTLPFSSSVFLEVTEFIALSNKSDAPTACMNDSDAIRFRTAASRQTCRAGNERSFGRFCWTTAYATNSARSLYFVWPQEVKNEHNKVAGKGVHNCRRMHSQYIFRLHILLLRKMDINQVSNACFRLNLFFINILSRFMCNIDLAQKCGTNLGLYVGESLADFVSWWFVSPHYLDRGIPKRTSEAQRLYRPERSHRIACFSRQWKEATESREKN